jgi:hypothetical protein
VSRIPPPTEPRRVSFPPRRRAPRRSVKWGLALGLPIVLMGSAAGVVALVGFSSASESAVQAPAADPNPACTLIVPPDPLTAAGLATPYQLTATDDANGPCNEANVAQSAFVEAAVVTADGQMTIYDPLVVDKGTKPAAATVPATVPDGATVGIWFGFNGTDLTLASSAGGDSLNQGTCVNGLQGSIFGQFAYCNGVAFFQAANKAITAGTLTVPPIGTATDGLPCPTTRSFDLVDQDQSDNVVTHYLANADGQTAQNNKANAGALGAGATDLANGSDNLLLDQFVDPALGCQPGTSADQSSDNQPSGSLPLDELSAAAGQQAPIALVPLNNPMTLVADATSEDKTNTYRVGVDQMPIGAGGDDGDGATYCTNLFGDAAGIQRVFKDQATFRNAPSVDPAMATNLFTFLAMRANQSFTNLGCDKLLNVANPITLTLDGNQVVTDATFTTLGQAPPGSTCGPTTTTTDSAPVSGTTTATGTASGTATGTAAPTGTDPTSAGATPTGTTSPGAPSTGGPTSTGTTTTTGDTSATAPGGTTTTAGTTTTTAGATTTTAGTTTTTTAGGTTTTDTTTSTVAPTGTCTPPTSTAPVSTSPSSTTTGSSTGTSTKTNNPPNPWKRHKRPHW